MTRFRGLRRTRVALAAVPPLLAASLRALLDDGGADVSVILDSAAERFDVAIVTPDGPRVEADVRIVLDDSPAARGGGTIYAPDGHAQGRLADVQALLRFVRDASGS